MILNEEAALLFYELADRLDLAGELPFKSAAYRKVAAELRKMTEPLNRLIAEGQLDKIPGAGKAIREKLVELASTGKLTALDKIRRHDTAIFYPLLSISGIKPAALARLIKITGAQSISQLLDFLQKNDKKTIAGQAGQMAELILANRSKIIDR